MTIAFVQKTTATGVTATTITTPAFASPTTVGNVLIAQGGTGDSTNGNTCTFTDSKSNTWVTNKQTNTTIANGSYVAIGSTLIATGKGGTSHTVTFTEDSAATVGRQLVTSEWSGLTTTVDQSASNVAGASTTTLTATTSATTNANDLVVGVFIGDTNTIAVGQSNPPKLNGSTTGVNSLEFVSATTVLAIEAAYAIIGSTGTQAVNWTYSSDATGAYTCAVVVYEGSASASVPFVPIDTDERIFPKLQSLDFAPPNLLAQQTLKLPPFTQQEIWPRTFYRGIYTEFIPPNLLTQGTLPLPPFTQENDGARTFWKGVYTDFSPPNLLAPQTLKPPPVTPIDLSQRIGKWAAQDFIPPTVLSPVVPSPYIPIDLGAKVFAKTVSPDFTPPNILAALLPRPPVFPGDPTTGIRIKGVFTDFAPPNLTLSTLAPEAATPILPQDISGIRLEARGLRSDFIPPNLTLFLPILPPVVSAPAGRHGSRDDARRRRELDVLRAKIEAFKEQRADAERALIETEDREVDARTRVLKKIRLKATAKPVEQYAPVARAIAARNVALDRHRAILEHLTRAQLEHDGIQREIERADEEAALYLMQWLMMEIEWRE